MGRTSLPQVIGKIRCKFFPHTFGVVWVEQVMPTAFKFTYRCEHCGLVEGPYLMPLTDSSKIEFYKNMERHQPSIHPRCRCVLAEVKNANS